MIEALEVTVYAPIASFRDPMYSGVQIGLPVPPPSTVGGMLAAAAGGWPHVPPHTRFAMTFHAEGEGVDLETYRPVHSTRQRKTPVPKRRPFLTGCHLTIWLTTDIAWWGDTLHNPIYPTRLGRSQDLADLQTQRVHLIEEPGQQRHALIPDDTPGAQGELLQLATAITENRLHTQWNTYRHATHAPNNQLHSNLRTHDNQAVVLLPPAHPATISTPTH